MPGNPLEALKKASSIGPDPYAVPEGEIKRGEMVGPMFGLVGGGMGGILGALKSLFKRPAEAALRPPPQIHHLTAQQIQNMDRMYQQANPIFKGLEKAGMFAGERNITNLPRPAITPVQETLGERAAEFAPVGGEEFYNIGKRVLRKPLDAAEAAYNKILERGGR